MKMELKQVQLEDREILCNLLEKYDYEFSQYDNRDVNKLGLYGNKYLDCYWLEDNRWAYSHQLMYIYNVLYNTQILNCDFVYYIERKKE